MSNTWHAEGPSGRFADFKSQDFDQYELADHLGLPVSVIDVADDGKLVCTIELADDLDDAHRLKVTWEVGQGPEFVPPYHGPEDPRIAERATVVKLEKIASEAKVRAAKHVAIGHHQDAAWYFGYAAGLERAVMTVEGRDHSPS